MTVKICEYFKKDATFFGFCVLNLLEVVERGQTPG
jgi:hypothetical protein